jgi:hypothetical protein
MVPSKTSSENENENLGASSNVRQHWHSFCSAEILIITIRLRKYICFKHLPKFLTAMMTKIGNTVFAVVLIMK